MKALVLSGGGSKGAFQVGALLHLINNLNRSYDIICGVSVGALNASFLSMYPKIKEKNAINDLYEFWLTVTPKTIYKRWFPFGRLHALWEKSLYNSQPLIDLMHDRIKLDKIRKSGKSIAVGAVSLKTGNYKLFTQNDDCFVDAVLASASFPGALKPIKINDEFWTDGGVKHVTPIKAAIDLGADEIDIIMCSPEMSTAKYDEKSATLALAIRSIDLMTDQLNENDLKLAHLYNKLALSGVRSDKRYVSINTIRPEKNLIEDSLVFGTKEILSMLSEGYSTATKSF